MHRGSRRWKPGDQHLEGARCGARRAIAGGHGAVDDHAGAPRSDSPGGSRASAALRARAAGVEIGTATESGREHRGGPRWECGNACKCGAGTAAAWLADDGLVALAGEAAGHSQARRSRAHEGLCSAARPCRCDGRCGRHVSYAGALSEPAHICASWSGRARRVAARNRAGSIFANRAAPVQRGGAAIAGGHAQFCAAAWI